MNILITGIPAVGKSTIAKELGKFGYEVYCDKEFINKTNAKNITEYKQKEKDVDLKKFAKTINTKLKNKKNFILEGILSPYCLDALQIHFDYIFVLSLPEKQLRLRYKKRKYPEAKILDNLYVQETNSLYANILGNCLSSKQKDKPLVVEQLLSGNLSKDLIKIVDTIYGTFLGK